MQLRLRNRLVTIQKPVMVLCSNLCHSQQKPVEKSQPLAILKLNTDCQHAIYDHNVAICSCIFAITAAHFAAIALSCSSTNYNLNCWDIFINFYFTSRGGEECFSALCYCHFIINGIL